MLTMTRVKYVVAESTFNLTKRRTQPPLQKDSKRQIFSAIVRITLMLMRRKQVGQSKGYLTGDSLAS